MSIKSKYYGRTRDGREVYQYILENAGGMRVTVLEYGCVVAKLEVPDNTGELRDVVLGYNTLEDYELGTASLGAFIGRCANRIEGARFAIDGKTYRLEPNDGKNHLHGSFSGMVYKGSIVDGALALKGTSPDGDDGFPGTVEITVRYMLTDDDALIMDYKATTDAPTLVNLTNHSYFNLEGHASGSMLEQTLRMNAVSFTEGNDETCPTGRILRVAGTPMDFTKAKPIGQDIRADYDQLTMCQGYDHNFILNKPEGRLDLAATARAEKTGIVMDVYTTQPGVQLYTGNYLARDTRPGKAGGVYGQYQGFCLETQHYPCAPSHPEFPSVELRPGETYHETTIYQFRVE